MNLGVAACRKSAKPHWRNFHQLSHCFVPFFFSYFFLFSFFFFFFFFFFFSLFFPFFFLLFFFFFFFFDFAQQNRRVLHRVVGRNFDVSQ